MTESRENVRPRMLWGAVVIAALLIGGVVWGVIATSNSSTPNAAATPVASVPATPTEWPTPSPGATKDVPSVAPTEVSVDQTASPLEGVTVRVISVERFDATSSLPGDLAGPAIRVTVQVTNSGSQPLDTAGASLTTAFGDSLVPGAEIAGSGASLFPATLSPGDTVKAIGTFAIPDGQDTTVRVNVDLLAGKPAIVFSGNVPKP